MSMHNPDLYSNFNFFQRRDAKKILEDFKEKVDWKRNASIVDLGSGDGMVTSTILKPKLPEDFKELIGTDIAEEMVDHANKLYGDDKTKFVKMDIVGDIPENFRGRFDFAFSSYLLQFVPNIDKAFQNIYDLLSKEGNCLILMLGSGDTFQICFDMTAAGKWRDSRNHIEQAFPKYMLTQEVEKYVESAMKKAGFKDIIVKKERTYYEYEHLNCIRKLVESANMPKLEGAMLQEFLDEFMEILVTKDVIELLPNTTAFRKHYSRLFIFGKK